MRKRTKFLILRASVLLAFALLAGRVWYVQVVMGSYYKAQGDTSKIRTIPVQARRGIIYDDAGRQLVWNAPSWTINIVPHGIPDNRATYIYRTLSHLLGGKPGTDKIRKLVRKNEWAPYKDVLIKRDVPTNTATVIIQYHNRLPGVRVELSSVRRYRMDPTFALSHILGYAGVLDSDAYKTYKREYPKEHVSLNDQVGKNGVELQLDPYLHGVNGKEQVEVDAGERPVRTLRSGGDVAGDSVYLTIDWKLQHKVAHDLQQALNYIHLRRGVAVLEDVRTGAIKAMVSLPSFNANDFSHIVSPQEYAALTKDPSHPLSDLATQGTFPPGSTFKIITAAAALQTHVVNGSTIVNDTGEIDIRCAFDPSRICQPFHGWAPPPGLGPMNMVSALAQSSDIYFWTVAGGNPNLGNLPYVGADRLASYARLLGLDRPTGIELPNEASGLILSKSQFTRMPVDNVLKSPTSEWHIGDTYNMAIGQGFDLVTPLQMVNVTAAIANNGTLYRPRIISRIRGRVLPKTGTLKKAQTIQPFVPSIIRRGFLDPETIALIQQGMHQSVQPFPSGTSYMAIDPRIDAAGKTGTAEDHPEGQPNLPEADAWWVGYAPYSHPRVAVVVLVPNASSEGAFTSAPIALKLLQDYFNLPPKQSDWLTTVTRSLAGTGGH